MTKTTRIYILAALASLVYSFIVIKPAIPINPDGMLYIRCAHAFLTDGFSAAAAVYRWPFFAITFALISKLTGLSLEYSAYLLNAGFHLLIVLSFMKLTEELGGNFRTLLCGAIAILSLHDLGHHQYLIIRDFGYYSFYTLALLCLVRYAKTSQLTTLLAWWASIVVAMLFRIEGAIFLCLGPFILLALPGANRRTQFGIAALPLLAGLSLLLVPEIRHFGRIAELGRATHDVVFSYWDIFHGRMLQLQQHVLTGTGQDYDVSGIIGLHFSMYLQSFLQSYNFLFAGLTLYAIRQKLLLKEQACFRIVFYFVAINFIITFLFLIKDFFLVYRYMLALCITLLLTAPFALSHIYTQWREKTTSFFGEKRWAFPCMVVFLVGVNVGNVGHFGYYKSYIKTAGVWASKHLPTNTTICSNDRQFAYYSRPFTHKNPAVYNRELLSDKKLWRRCDYIGLRLRKGEKLSQYPLLTRDNVPLFSTHNKRPEYLYIFATVKRTQ